MKTNMKPPQTNQPQDETMGLCGLYSFDPRPDRMQIRQIAGKMSAAKGAKPWLNENHPIALSNAVKSASGRYVLQFYGTLSNAQDIDTELGLKGKTGANPDTLLAAIDVWGVQKTLTKISGSFAFALWDERKHGLYLVRDHTGKKPFFTGWAGSHFLFADDLSAFRKHPDFSPDISRSGLTAYMRFGHAPAPLCIFDKCTLIPPGCFIALDVELLRAGQDIKSLIEPYWHYKNAVQKARENTIEDEQRASETLENLLKEFLRANNPDMVYLSGDKGSGLLAALAQTQKSTPLKTVTLQYDPENKRTHKSTEWTKTLKTDHHDIPLETIKLPEILTAYAENLGQPNADPLDFALDYLGRQTHGQNILIGKGAGLLFGTSAHAQTLKIWTTINNIPANLRKPFSQIIHAIPPKYWNKISRSDGHGGCMHRLADMMQKQSQADLYLGMNSIWQTPKSFILRGLEENIPLVDPDNQLTGLSFAEDMLYWQALITNNAIQTGQIAPFTDKGLFDYAWRLPVEMKINNGKTKIILQKLLSKYAPGLSPGNEKTAPPIDRWLTNDLREWANDLLDPYELRAHGLLDYHHVENLWKAHTKGRGNHAQKLWTVLIFQQWYRQVRTP